MRSRRCSSHRTTSPPRTAEPWASSTRPRSSTCRHAAWTGRRQCASSSRASSSRSSPSFRTRPSKSSCARRSPASSRPRARTSRPMPPVAESALDVRADFPILARRFDGRRLVYLDSGATAQKPEVVIEAVAEHLRRHNANVHRGVYALAQEADAVYDEARLRVATFMGAEPETTIFTKNATEAINLVAYAWGRANVGAGDAVLITQMEHHANIVPWQVLCRARGASLRYLEVDERGELSLDALDSELARG